MTQVSTPGAGRGGSRTGGRWIVGIVALVAAALVASVVALLAAARRDAIERESRDLARWAAAVADTTQRTVFDADLLAAALEERLAERDATTPAAFEREAASRELHDWMRDTVLVTAGADAIAVVDAHGVLRNTSRVFPPPDIGVTDRGYFQQLRDHPDLPFVLTEPLQGRIASIETLLLARRLNGRVGEFLGIVTATIPTSRLTRQFASIFEGVPVTVTLQRRGGDVLLRYPAATLVATPPPPEVQRFVTETPARAASGTMHVDGAVEGEPYLLALHAVRGYPLVITLSKPQSAALADWNRQVRSMSALTAGAVLLLAAFGWMLARQWRLRVLAVEGERLRAANAELEARVEQRTEQLRAARDAAESASRAKSDFLSGMSHELRTPLNAVLGFAQLLESDPSTTLTPRQRDFVGHIRRSGEHLLDLINEVLDLARVEAGRLATSLEPVALMPVVRECVALVQTQAQARGVRIDVAEPDDEWHAQADRTRTRQVLLNLLSNAVKYNRPDGIVHIGIERRAERGDGADGARVRVTVRDSGGGLAPQQLARLFIPFERLGADDRPIEGTGIGLALSKRLMELMGGEIGVDSEVGVGSRFWVEWTQAQPSAASVPPGPPSPRPADAHALPLPADGAIDVLCIEDNLVNLALIEQILQRHPGVRLRTAQHPRAGLDLARERPPHLVLLDLDLPELDGYAVLRMLRADPRLRDVPVLAISANARPGERARGLAAGFAAYLTKPIDIEAFDLTFVALLAGSR